MNVRRELSIRRFVVDGSRYIDLRGLSEVSNSEESDRWNSSRRIVVFSRELECRRQFSRFLERLMRLLAGTMRMGGVFVFLAILASLHGLVAVNSSVELGSWSCSSDSGGVSESYRAQLVDVLDAMETDILAYSSWDILYSAAGDGNEGVSGSAGCTPSKDVKNTEECYSCMVVARHHLTRLCPNNSSGSVALTDCSLTFWRWNLNGPEVMDPEAQLIDDEYVAVQRADS